MVLNNKIINVLQQEDINYKKRIDLLHDYLEDLFYIENFEAVDDFLDKLMNINVCLPIFTCALVCCCWVKTKLVNYDKYHSFVYRLTIEENKGIQNIKWIEGMK